MLVRDLVMADYTEVYNAELWAPQVHSRARQELWLLRRVASPGMWGVQGSSAGQASSGKRGDCSSDEIAMPGESLVANDPFDVCYLVAPGRGVWVAGCV